MSEEEIKEHNKRVKDFWNEYNPKIKAITKDQAKQIYDLGWRQMLPMNQIAEKMQGKLDFEVPMQYDIAIGMTLYQRALEMFDLYDDDFRPKPKKL